MYIVGEEEVEAVSRVVRSRKLFRYGVGQECDVFESRYAAYLAASHFTLSASGTNALTAAMIGVGLGPGDEVLVPAHTFMATATSVLAVGAIPVIVDIDESITLDPIAFENAIGPQTRAVIPVHMWGSSCDMDAIMRIARRRKLFVVEDACQGVGGEYRGKKLGTIGDVGAYSFNYFKNMSAGEGGGVATNDGVVAARVRCAIDPCNFYINDGDDRIQPFAGNGARASEFVGAMLNVQLDRLDGMIGAMRQRRDEVLAGIESLLDVGVHPAPLHCKDGDCGNYVIINLPSSQIAKQFSERIGGRIAGETGRHTYTDWDQILMGAGASHSEMNPYNMAANAPCRRTYTREMCSRSLEILSKTLLIPTDPRQTQEDIEVLIENVKSAATAVLGAQLDRVGVA